MKEKRITIFPVRRAAVKAVEVLHAQRLGMMSRAQAKMAARQASRAHCSPPWQLPRSPGPPFPVGLWDGYHSSLPLGASCPGLGGEEPAGAGWPQA